MNAHELQRRLDELAGFAVDLEQWADDLRRQNRLDLDDAILDAILAARPIELSPIDLDAWLASDWPLREVTAALGL